MTREIISVIVPIFKGNRYIKNIIRMMKENADHMIDHSYSLELILVNDYPDEQLSVPQSNLQGISVKLLLNDKNEGIHCSKIKGLLASQGKYILFLDQDDTLENTYIDSQIKKIDGFDAAICNGLYRNGEKIFSESNTQEKKYDFANYLDAGYPLISLGQMLIRRAVIPQEWIKSCMKYNGWDDHFLWALMMFYQVKIKINRAILYTHEENGENASLNWKEMYQSGLNYKEIFIRLNLLSDNQKRSFNRLINRKLYKYSHYEAIDYLWKDISSNILEQYFILHEYNNIAIYGMGIYGKKLYSELKGTKVDVKYGIDKRRDIKQSEIKIEGLDTKLEPVDVIVVTASFEFDKIQQDIHCKVSCDVVSLYHILKECKIHWA